MMLMTVLLLLFWVLCGIGAAGFANAYFRGEFGHIRCNDKEGWFNLCHCCLFGIFGPITLFISFFLSGFFYYGWTLRWRAESE